MVDEPRNLASDRLRRILELMSNRSFMCRDGQTLVTSSFVRHDRRRLVGQPVFDRDDWIRDQLELEELAGQWPIYQLLEVIATRGERLVAHHSRVTLGDVGEVEAINVLRMDETVERMESSYYFDPEDIDTAIAELDRLHAELDGD